MLHYTGNYLYNALIYNFVLLVFSIVSIINGGWYHYGQGFIYLTIYLFSGFFVIPSIFILVIL